MRVLLQEEPEAEHCGRITTMWVHWVDSYGAIYLRGFQTTWICIRELVDAEEDVEYSAAIRLETLLAPPSSPTSTAFDSANSVIHSPSDGTSSNEI